MGKSFIEKQRAALDKKEPWSKDEKAAYQERDRQFIRDIQIKDGISKAKAKRKFINYLNSSDKSKRKINSLRNQVRDMLQRSSPPSHAEPIPITEQKHKKPEAVKERKVKSPIQYAKATSSPDVRKRILSAHKRYPDASTYELRYGVNSRKSQEYRLRNGRSREYDGVVNE